MSRAHSPILGPQVEDSEYHSILATKHHYTGADQNLSAERRGFIALAHDVDVIDIPVAGAQPGIVRLTAAGSGAPLQIGLDLIRRVHPLGHGSALEVIGFSEHVAVLKDPATVNQRRIQAAREDRMRSLQRAEADDPWDRAITSLTRAERKAEDAVEHIRSAKSWATEGRRARRSPEANYLVECAMDAERDLEVAIEHVREATHVPAPPRTHLPPARLTYGEPPEAA